ncbi:MAG: DinB family protein [Isosphaeraceae bacterium]
MPTEPTSKRSAPLIERFAMGPAILAYAVANLDLEQERARPGPGAWSITELVHHLVDTDLVYAERMKRVIAEENPVLQNFDENAWCDRLSYNLGSVEEAVNLLAANRRWMLPILRRCSDADFARAGTHTERGRLTLAELLATMANHVDHHLRFLYVKRANLGVALPPRYASEAIEAMG